MANRINKKIKAFSLIEISIVMLIIGVIITGISKSSELYEGYILKIAQVKTGNSPVKSIPDIEFWIEATRDESFDEISRQDYDSLSVAETDSNQFFGVVGSWYDMLSQLNEKFSNSSKEKSPRYKTNCINSLPCVYFDGTDDFLNFPHFPFVDTEFTIFIVEKPDLAGTAGPIISPDSFIGGLYESLSIVISDNKELFFNQSTSSSYNIFSYQNGNESKARIHTLTSFFENKIIQSTIEHEILYESNNSLTDFPPQGNGISNGIWGFEKITSEQSHLLGSGFCNDGLSSSLKFYKGAIGEIIMYSRSLKASERKSVQKYLMDKWRID